MSDKIKIIKLADPNYPKLLQQIHLKAKQIYIRGNIDILNHPRLLAVVGSRKCSYYGQQSLHTILEPAVLAGVPLVSGLAYGIDSLAHQLCLKHNQPTIAVLGSGIDDTSLYPHRHLNLAHQIIKQSGAIISEYEPGTPALPQRFPARNRIIAGLCQATLVIQAAERSGSLVTARLALESNREVWAVPGAITDFLAHGTNWLIKQGATPITCAQDILDRYNLNSDQSTNSPTSTLELTKLQQKIINKLSTEPQHIDELAELVKLSPVILSVTLIELELINAAQNVGGMKYVKK